MINLQHSGFRYFSNNLKGRIHVNLSSLQAKDMFVPIDRILDHMLRHVATMAP